MADYGWTYSDLAGELWARGVEADDFTDTEIGRVLDARTPEMAADTLVREI